MNCEEGDLVLWDSRVAHANTNSRVAAPSSGDAPPPDVSWFGVEDGSEASPSKRRERAKRRLSTLAGLGQFSIHKDCVPQLQRLVAPRRARGHGAARATVGRRLREAQAGLRERPDDESLADPLRRRRAARDAAAFGFRVVSDQEVAGRLPGRRRRRIVKFCHPAA